MHEDHFDRVVEHKLDKFIPIVTTPHAAAALFHLGGTRIFGIMLTMDGKQGAEAIKIIAPRTVIPIHFNDYPVFKSHLEDFAKAVQAAGLENSIKYLNAGETYTFEVPTNRQ